MGGFCLQWTLEGRGSVLCTPCNPQLSEKAMYVGYITDLIGLPMLSEPSPTRGAERRTSRPVRPPPPKEIVPDAPDQEQCGVIPLSKSALLMTNRHMLIGYCQGRGYIAIPVNPMWEVVGNWEGVTGPLPLNLIRGSPLPVKRHSFPPLANCP